MMTICDFNVCFEADIKELLYRIWNIKGDSSICIKIRVKNLNLKIKNFSSVKYHKEMKDT